jgi:hypothetical protein
MNGVQTNMANFENLGTYIADNGIEYGHECHCCGGSGVVDECVFNSALYECGEAAEEEIEVECDNCYGTGYEEGLS